MSEEATSVPRRRGDELLSMLAERIGARLGAATVFGAPVERDGVTVVPVAVARCGHRRARDHAANAGRATRAQAPLELTGASGIRAPLARARAGQRVAPLA